MSQFLLLFQRMKERINFCEISPYTSKDILEEKVKNLNGDEIKIFEWILQYYSDAWIAETLMISRRKFKEAEKKVFLTLGVCGRTGLLRVYGYLAKNNNVMPDTNEIDNYIEKRDETNFQM